MTVAEKIAQRKIELACILNDSNNAISAKGGTPADNLSGLQDAIVSIPTGGVVLPVLTNPAEVGDVIAGKEYIDGAGMKRVGTLVVCDTIEEAESFGEGGVGLQVDLESSADGSSKTLTIPEPNLLPENIKNGVSIFGIAGSAKTMRVETGTITPAEDTNSITIPCSDGAKAFILEATDDAIIAIEGQSQIIYAVSLAGNFMLKHNAGTVANTAMNVWYKTRYAMGGIIAQNSGGVTLSLNYNFYPGAYRWSSYYWEDDT